MAFAMPNKYLNFQTKKINKNRGMRWIFFTHCSTRIPQKFKLWLTIKVTAKFIKFQLFRNIFVWQIVSQLKIKKYLRFLLLIPSIIPTEWKSIQIWKRSCVQNAIFIAMKIIKHLIIKLNPGMKFNLCQNHLIHFNSSTFICSIHVPWTAHSVFNQNHQFFIIFCFHSMQFLNGISNWRFEEAERKRRRNLHAVCER